jgi:iron-sulfur cluster assembly protein
MEVTIKEKAQEMLDAKLEEGQFLRITIVKGGCAGLTYGAEIAKELQADESVVFQAGKIKIVSTPESSQYLNGLVVDYSNDLIHGGLQFTNSKSKSTCGCGQSFNLSGFPVLDKGTCGK